MEQLKVIETFSGVGMQRRGIELSEVYDPEIVATSETDIYAIIDYAAIHNDMTEDMVREYSYYPSRQEMADELSSKNIGYDWIKNKPYNWNKIAKSKDAKMLLKKTWLACKLNNNVGDICKVEHLPYCDMLIYSSPCTDYSLSGKQSGTKIKCNDCKKEFNPLDYDVQDRYSCPFCGSIDITSTRSGLIVEIERLLVNMISNNNAPKYLLQENVDALVSNKFIEDFKSWIKRLDKLGYNTYWDLINLKNCSTEEIPTPQNRKRLFSISIRKDIDNGQFKFPIPFDSGIRLKDILLDEVDDKYYIDNPKARELINSLELEGKLDGYK